jgi:hypothetical protein
MENFMDLKETKYSCSRNNYNNLNYNKKHKHPHLTPEPGRTLNHSDEEATNATAAAQ